MKYKVGICGFYAEGTKDYGGQPVKTRVLTEEIKKIYGHGMVETIDTYNWRKKIILLLIKCFNLSRTCENIIILPANKGIKIFVPLFLFLNKIYQRKLHYVVIGGWLPDLLKRNNKLKKSLKEFTRIYVETYSMVESLQMLGLTNVSYLPNFKKLNILNKSSLIYPQGAPYKLCTFSRVMKEKGIEDAIQAVININEMYNCEIYTLDIYGQVDENYKIKFNELMKELPLYISYKGIIKYDESVDVLKNYLAVLFPTYYQGEGFAGTILDAYSSGVPVIASDWKYNSEIIRNEIDGIIFKHNNVQNLTDVLISIMKNPNIISSMKESCLKRAIEFSPEVIIHNLLEFLL